MHAPTANRFAVSVVMERELIEHRGWRVPRWRVAGVLAGEAVSAQRERVPVPGAHEGYEQYLYRGFAIELHRDSGESYWHNLMAATPKLFVICREDETGELAPFAVTANYDEAGAYLEADDTVLSAPMPPEVYRWLERYVVEHCRPSEPKKRRRARWGESDGGEKGGRARG